MVELAWNSGGMWWNWGGAQGSAQRWNCGGAAVGCGGTAEGCDTERNCTNTCTHLQVEHRNKLYKYKQNQLQNKTNYNSELQHKTNYKQNKLKINSTTNQFNTNSTQNQFNTLTIITNSMQTQSNHVNSIQLNQLHQTQLNQTCISSMNVTDECEVCAENACLKIKTNRNKLYK